MAGPRRVRRSASDRVAMADDIADFADRAFRREVIVSPDGAANLALRFVLLTMRLQQFFINETAGREELLNEAAALLRLYDRLGIKRISWRAYLADAATHLSWLEFQSPLERSAWSGERLGRCMMIPSMLDDDTKRYYKWLGSNAYTGAGAAVELGPWLGSSTVALLEGLETNPAFAGRRLQTFDSFVWGQWMTESIFPRLATRDVPAPGESFLGLFHHYMGEYRDWVEPKACYLERHAAQLENHPAAQRRFVWSGEPIELLIYDFGVDVWEIDRVWDLLADSFISGRTVIVLNPYGNARSEGLRQFCRDKAIHLRAIHKPQSSAKGFLFI